MESKMMRQGSPSKVPPNQHIKVIPNTSIEALQQRLRVSSTAKSATEHLNTNSKLLSSTSTPSLTTTIRERIPTYNPIEEKVKALRSTGNLKDVTRELAKNPYLCTDKSTAMLQSASSSALRKDITNESKDMLKSTSSIDTIHETSHDKRRSDYSNQSHTNTVTLAFGLGQNFLSSLNFSEKQYYDLMNVPNTFFYLRTKGSYISDANKPSKPSASNKSQSKLNIKSSDTDKGKECDSVYDLELISQHQVDKRLYFTLSKEGVTMFRDKTSTFTSLSQWERDYTLYHKIVNIHFFKLYRRWKAFTVWKNSIHFNKRMTSSESLQGKLFLFNPPLYRSLMKIKGLCIDLAKQANMISLDPPGRIFDLEEFISCQQKVHETLKQSLSKLSATVLSSVRAACDEVVDNFLKTNNIIANHKMTFMERAALRAECKRLTCFLRMVDITMNDFLLSMVVESVDILAKAVHTDHSSAIQPRVETSSTVSTTDLVQRRIDEEVTPPVFIVLVNFKKRVSGEAWEEVISIRPSLDQLTKRIDSVITSSIEVVSTFVKVFSSPETEMYVMPDGDDDDTTAGDAGNEPSDLSALIRANSSFSSIRDQIFRHLRHSYNAVREYIHVFEPFRQLYFENQTYIKDIPVTFENGTFEGFQESIMLYRAMITKFQDVPRYADVGALFVDSDEMKTQLMPSPVMVLDAIKAWLPELALKRAKELVDEVGTMNPIISSEPSTVEGYVNKKKTKDLATEKMEEFKDRQSYIRSLVHLLDDNNWIVNDNLKVRDRSVLLLAIF